MKNCPICQEVLKEVPKYGVMIDFCPRCRGVWLDRGELEKVVALARDFDTDRDDFHESRRYDDDRERYERRSEPEKSNHHERHEDYKDYHKKKKKRGLGSLFEDLFDS